MAAAVAQRANDFARVDGAMATVFDNEKLYEKKFNLNKS